MGTNLAYLGNRQKISFSSIPLSVITETSVELSVITETSEVSNMVATNHICLLDTYNVTRINEELSFIIYLSLMDLATCG